MTRLNPAGPDPGRTRLRAGPLLGVLLLALAGCTQPVRVDGAWRDGVTQQSYGRILVVALHPEYNQRRNFEVAMVRELQKQGVEAVRSTTYMRLKDPLTREGITPVVQQTGVDAVLITRVVSRDLKAREVGGEVVVKPVAWINDPFYYMYDYLSLEVEWYGEASTLTFEGTLDMETRLFEAAAGNLVYGLASESKAKVAVGEYTEDVVGPLAAAIASRLRQDGALR